MKTTEDTLRDKEMEMEILKNQLRDQKSECQHLRESVQTLKSTISNGNSGEVEQKVIILFSFVCYFFFNIKLFYSYSIHTAFFFNLQLLIFD